MKKWDVFLANVPFEECIQSKIRPVVILEISDTQVIVCLKMTGQPPRQNEYVLRRWKDAGLHKPTTVRLSKRLVLNQKLILKQIGCLHALDILEIEKRLSL